MIKEFETSKNSLVVYLHGEIDQYAAAELKTRIDIEVKSSTKRNLIIDLSHVELMDSSGIGLIVGRYKLTTSLGGKFAVCNASDYVKKMIELSGITKVINYYSNVSEAEKAFIN